MISLFVKTIVRAWVAYVYTVGWLGEQIDKALGHPGWMQ